MAQITITVPDDAAALALKHAIELGYDAPDDWAFELLRNFTAHREDQLYTRMPAGELNPVFGRSRREQADLDKRVAAEAAAAELAQQEVQAQTGADKAA